MKRVGFFKLRYQLQRIFKDIWLVFDLMLNCSSVETVARNKKDKLPISGDASFVYSWKNSLVVKLNKFQKECTKLLCFRMFNRS